MTNSAGAVPAFPARHFQRPGRLRGAGESAEDAVVREVYEETHIVVEDVRYFGSQPWPFPNSLMLGFTADEAAKLIPATTTKPKPPAGSHATHCPRPFRDGSVFRNGC